MSKDLDAMMLAQKKLQVRLYPNFEKFTMKERTAYIKEHSIHLNQEINEMLYELPYFKPWKDYSNMNPAEIAIAFGKAGFEFIDAWHFMLNIALMLGLDAETLSLMYFSKNADNHKRQDDGYTHDVSYREEAKELTEFEKFMDDMLEAPAQNEVE